MKSFRHFSTLAFALCMTAALTSNARAQATCGNTGAAGTNCAPAGTTAGVTLQHIVFMSISPAAATLTAPTDLDFTAGGTTTKTDVNAHVITVRANSAWTLTVKGAAWTGTGNNAKAISDLTWSKTGGAPFTAMTNAAVTLNTGVATASVVTNVTYLTNWALASDSPGTYTMALTFTLTAP